MRTALAEAISGSRFSATSLGRAIERGPDYVRDFLNGRKESLGASEIAALERALGVDFSAALANDDVPPKPAGNVRPVPDLPSLRSLSRSRGPKVPVQGVAVGGDEGDFRFNGETVNWLPRPAAIADNKDVYALYVANDSMTPLYKPGNPVYVDPHRVPSVGDCVIVELHPESDGSPGPGFVKQLVRRSGSTLVVEQFNPAKEIVFDMRRVKALHRVIPWIELLGL